MFRRRKPQPSQPLMVEVKGEPEHAWKALSLVNSWVAHAETKAGATLAATGVVGGVLFSLMEDRRDPGWNLDLFATLCAVSVIYSGFCAAMALWPRLGKDVEPSSPLYFRHIARKHPKVATYQETLAMLTRNGDQLIQEIAAQVHANAGVAHRKFIWTSWALRGLMAAIAMLTVVVLIIGWRSR